MVGSFTLMNSEEGMVRSFTLMKIVSPCWKPSQESRGDDSSGRFGAGRTDGLLWYKDLGRHAGGEFSMAVVQANNLLEDGSQIESGPLSLNEANPPHGTFVGVYDGHGGPETSKYITNNLFWNLMRGKFVIASTSERTLKKGQDHSRFSSARYYI